MKYIEVNKDHVREVIRFCNYLKDFDQHPCSFWGYDEEVLLELLDNDSSCHIIVKSEEEEEEIIGLGKFIRGGFLQEHFAEIGLVVHPNFRKKGIASLLLNKLESLANNKKLKFIKAVILENNIPSTTFFKNRDYIKMAVLHDEFNLIGVGLTNDVIYHKKL